MSHNKVKYKDSQLNFPPCSTVEECQANLAKISKKYLDGELDYEDYKKAKNLYDANYSKTILESTSIFAYIGSMWNFFRDSVLKLMKRFK